MVGPAMPALLTRMSMRPCCFSVLSSARWIAAGSVTSVLSASLMSQTATFAPEASRRLTMAAPMPMSPPVTTAVRPLRSSWFISLLYCACHGRNVVFDEEGVEDHQRQRADQRSCHEGAPAVLVAVGERGDDGHRHRLLAGGVDEGERVDELVPAQRHAEDGGRDQAGHRERQDDAGEDLPARRAVDQGAFLEFVGDGLEIAHQQPGRE